MVSSHVGSVNILYDIPCAPEPAHKSRTSFLVEREGEEEVVRDSNSRVSRPMGITVYLGGIRDESDQSVARRIKGGLRGGGDWKVGRGYIW